jgi:hypothetical protein
MQRGQLTQRLQSSLHSGIDDAWRRKSDSSVNDSMCDCPYISDRILREKGIEHCLEGSWSLLFRQLRMRTGNGFRVLRGGVREARCRVRQRDRIETSGIKRSQPHRRAACVHH